MMNSEILIQSNYALPVLKRGKVRDIYEKENHLLIVSTDRVSAFDVILPNGIPSKGWALNQLSVYWLEKTKSIFPNHFIEQTDERSIEVLRADRIDIEWVARSHIYGSAWRKYIGGEHFISGLSLPNGLQLAEELPEIILTPTTKSEVGHDIELSKSDAINKGIVSRDEWSILEEATFRLYDFYKKEAARKDLMIPDFKLEYGKVKGELIQIDEPPTHDSARLWSKKHYRIGERQEAHSLDKEFLRDFLMRRGYTGDSKPPNLPPILIDQVSKRCVGAYKVLASQARLDDLSLMSVDEILRSLEVE